MIGQWCGVLSDTNHGFVTLNIEEIKNKFYGVLYLINNPTGEVGTPGLVCWIAINKDLERQTIFCDNVFPINPWTFISEENKSQFLSMYTMNNHDYKFPSKLEIELVKSESSLIIELKSDVGGQGKAYLENKLLTSSSKVDATLMLWGEFKEYTSEIDYRSVVFRGQEDVWPLRTSFHRNKRYDVLTYVLKDIPMLHGKISGLTKHFFNMNNDIEYGAFYNLLQHHGYPTPLLDWSYSPFVASFFAFKNLKADVVNKGEIGRRVRIFVFDIDAWKQKYAQYKSIADCRFHVSVGEFLPINNPRALPQQALTTYTNVYDIEGFIINHGQMAGVQFLKAIDIPVDEYYKAMKDLSLMGITSSTLFPGIDGMCDEMRGLNFPHN